MHLLPKRCIIRITAADREKLERLIFQRYPHKEWGTFFRFGFRRTVWGLAATFVSAEPPRPGDLDRSSAITVFRSKYVLRAHRIIENEAVAVGVIHSHPQGAFVSPSRTDDDMDAYFEEEFTRYGKGKPYLSVIFARERDRAFHFSGRIFDQGEWYPVTEMVTVGDEVLREQADWCDPNFEATDQEEPMTEKPTARLQTLVGSAGTKRLSSAWAGIIGCSGTGSPAAHVLARAGIGNFVLVDPQEFGTSNLERLHGSVFEDTNRDQPPDKVSLVENLIRAINPRASIISIKGNILDEVVLDYLLQCDLLLGCADTQHARAALGDLAAHYLLPSIDVGVTMRAKEHKLTTQLVELSHLSPGLPCPFCMGKIDPWALSYELMTEAEREQRRSAAKEAELRGIDGRQYWGGDPHPEVTVGYLTTLAGAMAAGYAENMIVGSAGMPHQRFQFDVGWTKLGVAPVESRISATCSCQRTIGRSDQARADRSVSRPPNWPVPQIIEVPATFS